MNHNPTTAGKQRLVQARSALAEAAAAAQRRAAKTTDRLSVHDSIARLIDAGSLLEYGSYAKPAAPGMHGAGDGLIVGIAAVQGQPVAVAAYDANVYAGTQSMVNNMKFERLLELAQRDRLPFVGWFNGGGMRPQDLMGEGTKVRKPNLTFVELARLSGLAPTVAIVAGPTFAGNAALAGLCDVIIASRSASMGMAGPALVESALGQQLTPQQIGPAPTLARCGVIDMLCDDEAACVDAARHYLSFFSERRTAPVAPSADDIEQIVPASAKRAYDMRKVVRYLTDGQSWFELRADYGRAMLTGIARIDGMSVGIVANQPMSSAGVMDSEASDKAARLVELCEVFHLPVVFLCDTPGFMCGPQAEASALIRRAGRLVSVLANATTPMFTVQLRKAYGLGHFMMGSAWVKPRLVLTWPDAEYGGMGIEGAVSLMHRRRLEAVESDADRRQLHQTLCEEVREANTAMETAGRFATDEVIEPSQTRELLGRALRVFTASNPAMVGRRPLRPW